MDYEDVFAARTCWMVALSALPKSQVFTLAHSLAARHEVRPVTVSQAGLALLPLRDSVQRKPFYLGEIPLSASRVEIDTDGGATVQGAALVMADDSDLADALAICDGVLTHRLAGWQEVADGVRTGLQSLGHQTRIRKTMLERSRVDFSLLNEDDAT
jgi:alpha-D-ribose 1-methylphosphonate 5-triphosphate synthase subunit PhnG